MEFTSVTNSPDGDQRVRGDAAKRQLEYQIPSGVQPASCRNSRIMCDWSKYPQSNASSTQRGRSHSPISLIARFSLSTRDRSGGAPS